MKANNPNNSQLVPRATHSVASISASIPSSVLQPVTTAANVPAPVSTPLLPPSLPVYHLTDFNLPSTSSAPIAIPQPQRVSNAQWFDSRYGTIPPPDQLNYTIPAVNFTELCWPNLNQNRYLQLDEPSTSGYQTERPRLSLSPTAALNMLKRTEKKEPEDDQPQAMDTTSEIDTDYTLTMHHHTPHLTERILDQTAIAYLKSLRSLIGKKNIDGYDLHMVKISLNHLLVKENIAEHNQFMDNIVNHALLSQADKTEFIKSNNERLVIKTREPGPNWTTEMPRSFNYEELIDELNEDFISILSQFGATEAQVASYLYFKKIAQEMINQNAIGMTEEDIENNILCRKPEDEIMITAMQDVSAHFQWCLKRNLPYLDENLDFPEDNILQQLAHPDEDEDVFFSARNYGLPGGVSGAIAEPEEIELSIELQTVRLLQYNYLRSAPVLTFFTQVMQHNPLLMKRSIVIPEQRAVATANDWHQYSRVLDREDCLRAIAFVTATPALYFILGEKISTSAIDSRPLTYGCYGLPFKRVYQWITDKSISIERLVNMGTLINESLAEITQTGDINLEWMNLFDDPTLERLFAIRNDLISDQPQSHGMVLLEALTSIGKVILRRKFDYDLLPELLNYIRTNFAAHCPEHLFSYLLFELSQPSDISLPGIAKGIIDAGPVSAGTAYTRGVVKTQLRLFCAKTITREAINKLAEERNIIAKINDTQMARNIYPFVARNFNTPIILQDLDATFINYYDASGHERHVAPANVAGSIIIRPGYLIPIAQNGQPQATIPLRYNNSHSLFTQLTRNILQLSHQPITGNQLENLVRRLEQQLLDEEAAGYSRR